MREPGVCLPRVERAETDRRRVPRPFSAQEVRALRGGPVLLGSVYVFVFIYVSSVV